MEEGGGGVGGLDVIKAIASLLVIIGLALGMLVLGYIFVPETFTTSGCTFKRRIHQQRWCTEKECNYECRIPH